MNQNDPLPGPHPHRGIFVSLVVAIILLIAVFGFFVYSAFFMTTDEPVVDDGKDAMITELENEVADLEGQIESLEQTTEELTNNTFTRFSEDLPRFDLPSTWYAVIQDFSFEGDLNRNVALNRDPIWICEACDGPLGPISVHSQVAETILGNHESFDAYVEAVHGSEFFSNIETTKISEKEYHVTGRVSGISEQDFESIIYNAGVHLVTVRYEMYDPGSVDDAAWELIKNSLDFSNVQ